MGESAKAEPLYQRSLQICETKLGQDHREVLKRTLLCCLRVLAYIALPYASRYQISTIHQEPFTSYAPSPRRSMGPQQIGGTPLRASVGRTWTGPTRATELGVSAGVH